MSETRFVRPQQGLLDELVGASLTSAGVKAPRHSWAWIETGSSHVVVLAGDAAVRVARSPETSAMTIRTQLLVDALPPLPFDVPRSLTPATSIDGITAIASRRITGDPKSAGSAEPGQLRVLLDAIHSVELDPVRALLNRPRSYSGGEGWYSIMTEQAVPLLPERVRDAALRVADAVASLDPGAVMLNHGDLAGANILWDGGRISGVLDWDLASADDPADDLAAVAGWFGWGAVGAFATPADIRRATVFHDSFALQALCFSLVNHRPDEEVDRAVERATKLLREDLSLRGGLV